MANFQWRIGKQQLGYHAGCRENADWLLRGKAIGYNSTV